MTNQINNQSIIPSTDVIQLTLTLKMTTAQVVETSVTVNNNSPIQDYVHPDDQTQPFELLGSNLSQKKIAAQTLLNSEQFGMPHTKIKKPYGTKLHLRKSNLRGFP